MIIEGLRFSALAMTRALNPCCLMLAINMVFGLKLVVLRCLIHVHTLRWWVLHHTFEAALVYIGERYFFGFRGESDEQ